MERKDDQKLKKLDVEAKVEGNHTSVSTKFNTKAASSSRQWSAFKNPRIVRVSRAFGGKDRHSKVTTVRGLRDRRIRLSVPTAIQLYDLQDRLGVAQPSKVVDWLLDANKEEIDKLPPLPIPAGSFNGQFHQPALNLESNALRSSFSPFFNTSLSVFKDDETQSSFPRKDGFRDGSNFGDGDVMEKSKSWEFGSSEQNQDGSSYNPQVSAQNFFPIPSHSSFPNMIINNSIPYNSFYHLEHKSSLSLSQFENHGFQTQVEEGHTSHLQSLQPSNSLGLSSRSHLFLYPPTPTPSIFSSNHSYIGAPSDGNTRHANMFPPNPFMSSSLHLHSHSEEKEIDKSNNGG